MRGEAKALPYSSQLKNGERMTATDNHHLTMTRVWLILVGVVNVKANNWKPHKE